MNLSIQEILTQAGAFILLVWVLKRMAWKPLLKLLDERREKIRASFEEIEKAKKGVEELKYQYDQAHARIEEEARKKLQQAIDEGKQIARQLQEDSRREARNILQKAKEDITLEVDKAKVTLRNEIADLTLAATERLLHEKLDVTKDKEIVLDFIEDLEKLK
ncbi:MAG: ATP synthase F0 subunit B [Omnitrophica bacterium RIFCSPHIGHO2_02_FULL_46_11]|nr:MAG: ATP synthase F0 subunit B [Omnitrophica bacterium RIFCSPLOWO2_01_FULL_45_10b]OGW87844.1 MAG: ATP synthase F0 subunit B [Omnitrophica bacterium RIFCSPHIGHO2_02_FULL_46_11]